MLRVQCSKLEQVRKNPGAFAQFLATSENLSGGGTYGMFAHWQDFVTKVTNNEFDISEGAKELQRAFRNFNDTPKNLQKQDFLMDNFEKYIKEFRKKDFKFFDSKRRMNWKIIPNIHLTGLTPIVVRGKSNYYTYFFSEQPFDWKNELRFPLLQDYMSEHNLECDSKQLYIGIYCLASGSFEFINFSKSEIKTAISETEQLFEIVNSEYGKKRKATGKS